MDELAKLRRRIRQLERARQCWKQRVARKQQHIRYLRVKSRDLAQSRDRWKLRALAITADDDPDPAPPRLLPFDRPQTPDAPALAPHAPRAIRLGGA